MGQQEIYTFIKKHKRKWFTSKEIANRLKTSIGSVTICLKKLRESSTIDFKYQTKFGSSRKSVYVYRFK